MLVVESLPAELLEMTPIGRLTMVTWGGVFGVN